MIIYCINYISTHLCNGINVCALQRLRDIKDDKVERVMQRRIQKRRFDSPAADIDDRDEDNVVRDMSNLQVNNTNTNANTADLEGDSDKLRWSYAVLYTCIHDLYISESISIEERRVLKDLVIRKHARITSLMKVYYKDHLSLDEISSLLLGVLQATHMQ